MTGVFGLSVCSRVCSALRPVTVLQGDGVGEGGGRKDGGGGRVGGRVGGGGDASAFEGGSIGRRCDVAAL